MQTTPQHLIDHYTQQGWWGQDTLQSLFENGVSISPNHLALVDPLNREDLLDGSPQRLTFAELDALSDAMATTWFEAGIRKEDIVLLQLPNTVEIVLAYLAAAKLGVILSPLAMQYGQHELTQFANTVNPTAYVSIEQFMGKPFAASQAPALPNKCKVITTLVSSLRQLEPSPDYLCYRDSLEHNANDIFTICWTSGTTGRSKGVPRSHNHWLASTLACEDTIQLEDHAVILNPFPFVNMAAIGGFLYYWLKIRATMVLHQPFDPMIFLTQLQNEKIEYTLAPPAVLNRLLQTKDQIKAGFDLSNLRMIGSGSAPLSPDMISGFASEFNIDVVNIFGSNEGMAVLSGPGDVPDPKERAWYFPRFGCKEHVWNNRVSERIQTKLIDPETGEEITQADRAGECWIKGITVFDGYYQSPEDNAQAFSEDGYFRSGDLFEITGEQSQYYRFVGRCKSLILRGGVNISPEELDEIIESHPHVLEAAAGSYPDDILGEKICAYVVLAEGKTMSLNELTQFFNEKKVAKFKWPEKLVLLNALPRNAMNKVVRSELV